MSDYLSLLLQVFGVVGVIATIVVGFVYQFKGKTVEIDKGTIESQANLIGALRQELDEVKKKSGEQDIKLAKQGAELQGLRELVTQRAEVEKLHEDIQKFLPLIPDILQFKDDHERMLFMLTAIETALEVQHDHPFTKRPRRPKE